MFSGTFFTLLLSIFLWKWDCTVGSHTILGQNKKVNAIEYALNKYLNPLRKLTAELPNHAIEMQIEFFDQDPSLSPISVAQRRTLRESSRIPKKKARSNDDPSIAPAVSTQSDGTTSTATPEITTYAMTTESTENPVSGTTIDPRKRPVYMEDLDKALNNLEKKLLKNTTPPTTNIPCTGTEKPPLSSKPRGTRVGTVRNIADILQLLKKAVQVEKHIPQPHDENLDWVQIKIPKDMK